MNSRTPFWEKPLTALDRGEWEALCDGCGRCCIHKLEDEETGLLYPTNVACKLLDRRNGRCLDYKNRMKRVSDCVKLDRTNLANLDWLRKAAAPQVRRCERNAEAHLSLAHQPPRRACLGARPAGVD